MRRFAPKLYSTPVIFLFNIPTASRRCMTPHLWIGFGFLAGLIVFLMIKGTPCLARLASKFSDRKSSHSCDLSID